MAPYRPPGRSNRSGRSQTDNDVFEGLPVKQWGQSFSHVSLVPASSETVNRDDEKWGELPMPRDFQLLHPWTQQLLRLARSGKVGTKRKPHSDGHDDDKHGDDIAKEVKNHFDDRGYGAKKWKHIPEHLLEPEHKHFEFLAQRRKGLPNLYGPDQMVAPVIPMRRTKVQKIDENGQVTVYEVLVPEGQTVEGEVTESTELADAKPVAAAPGTVIEGVGVANEEGVVVAEHLKPAAAPRRNRPPPKKKGGPGRGKKRVTFTNPDGSTYTTVVPNATKIVPQPGQTVRHIAKGEEVNPDVTAEEAAAAATSNPEEGGEEGSGSDEGEDDGDDDDREEGELSEDDKDDTPNQSVPPPTAPEQNGSIEVSEPAPEPMEGVQITEPIEPALQGPIEPMEPMEVVEPAAVAEITEITEIAEPAEPAKPVKPTEFAVPIESAQLDEPMEPIERIPLPEPGDVAPPAQMPIDEPRVEPIDIPLELPPPPPLEVPVENPPSSPDAPLANASHSRTKSVIEPPAPSPLSIPEEVPEPLNSIQEDIATVPEPPINKVETEPSNKFDDGDEDLLGNLEKHLGGATAAADTNANANANTSEAEPEPETQGKSETQEQPETEAP